METLGEFFINCFKGFTLFGVLLGLFWLWFELIGNPELKRNRKKKHKKK